MLFCIRPRINNKDHPQRREGNLFYVQTLETKFLNKPYICGQAENVLKLADLRWNEHEQVYFDAKVFTLAAQGNTRLQGDAETTGICWHLKFGAFFTEPQLLKRFILVDLIYFLKRDKEPSCFGCIKYL